MIKLNQGDISLMKTPKTELYGDDSELTSNSSVRGTRSGANQSPAHNAYYSGCVKRSPESCLNKFKMKQQKLLKSKINSAKPSSPGYGLSSA